MGKIVSVDEVMLTELAKSLCTLPEIASKVGCSEGTLKNRYMDVIRAGWTSAKTSLRAKQFEVAMGNPLADPPIPPDARMLMFLGKVYLGQRDRDPPTIIQQINEDGGQGIFFNPENIKDKAMRDHIKAICGHVGSLDQSGDAGNGD